MPTPIFIDYLKLTFVAAKPPPSHVFTEVALMAAHHHLSLKFRISCIIEWLDGYW